MPVEGLVLWDIDKTLVDIVGVSREIYALAFKRVVGRPLGELAEMTGRTEHAILVDTLALNGVAETKLDAFYEALGWAAHELRARMHAAGRALPGAHKAIDGLRREGVIQSVATGNIRSIAETKLDVFGLARGIDFDVGGYGSDGGMRSDLVRLARERTNAKYHVELSPSSVVVLGDTVFDVEGAVGAGARAVGVATGKTAANDLAAAGAHAVLNDLESVDDLVTAVYGPKTSS